MMRWQIARKGSALLLRAALVWGAMHAVAMPQARAQNAAAAEALFDEGRRLLDAGKFDEACHKFAQSQELDPGTGTLLNLANCYEQADKLASAWTTWREAAASARSAGQSEREELARDMAAKLENQLARVTIQVSDEARVEGLTITQNNQAQHSAIWGTALPVDAGTYHIEASAPGYESWSQDVTIKNGQKQTVTIPVLQKGSGAIVAAPITEPNEEPAQEQPQEQAQQAEQPAPAADNAQKKSGNGLRTAGIIVGSVGLVSMGVGGYFGFRALAKNKDSKDYCRDNDPNQCTSVGVGLRDDARSAATISNIAIGVGAAALAGGVVMILVAPKGSTEVAAAPTLGGGHLLVRGTF